MLLCATLDPVQKRYVSFDPKNPEHLEAYRMLCIGTTKEGKLELTFRQHPTLRFYLEAPFETVPAMLHYRVGQAYLSCVPIPFWSPDAK